jgi:hypothetical protein
MEISGFDINTPIDGALNALKLQSKMTYIRAFKRVFKKSQSILRNPSPNLSPTGREALILTPLPWVGG